MISPDDTLILPIANGFARSYRMVDVQDVAQELREWWLTNQDRVEKWTAEDASKTDQAKLAKSLRNAAARYCRKEKAQKAGYRTSDEFFYDAEIIRTLLPYVWHPERIGTEQRQDPNAGRGRRPASEGNNLLAMVSDIGSAVDSLDGDDELLLTLRYGQDAPFDELSSLMQVDAHALEMRVHRAVERMVTFLGGRSPWSDGPGTRRAMSNAQALAVTRNQETR